MNPDKTSDIEEHSKELSNGNENFDASLTFDNPDREVSGESSTKKNNKTAIIAGTVSAVVVIAVIAVIIAVLYIKKTCMFWWH